MTEEQASKIALDALESAWYNLKDSLMHLDEDERLALKEMDEALSVLSKR